MRECLGQLEAPESIIRANFTEMRDFLTRFVDFTDDYKTKVLPRNEDYRLLKQVALFNDYQYWVFNDYQCRFCKAMFGRGMGFVRHWDHLKICEVRKVELGDWDRYWDPLSYYTAEEEGYRNEEEAMPLERKELLRHEDDHRHARRGTMLCLDT